MDEKKRMPRLRRAVFAVCLVVFVVSAGMLAYNHWRAETEKRNLAAIAVQITPPQQSEDPAAERLARYAALQAQNPDFGGWVRIDGTVIDYPVMFTPDEPEKYLRRAFDGSSAQSGVPFVGAGCTLSPRSDNVILYGHNMKNGTMFSALLSYQDKAFWEEHRTVYFATPEGEDEYEVFAALPTDIFDADSIRCYDFIDAESAQDFDAYLAAIRRAALYDTGVDVAYGDTLLTLSTCSYHTTDGRFVIVARKKAAE